MGSDRICNTAFVFVPSMPMANPIPTKFVAEPTLAGPPPPDLVVNGALTPVLADGTVTYYPRPGQPFALTWSVCNGGGSAAGSFTNRVTLDGSANNDVAEGGLAPITCVQEAWALPSGLSAGTHLCHDR